MIIRFVETKIKRISSYLTSSAMGRTKCSEVYKHFHPLKENKYVCRVCPNVNYKGTTGVSNLGKHVASKGHSERWEASVKVSNII